MKEKLQKAILKAAPELELKTEQVFLEHPSDIKLGDFSTNVAMVKAKEQKVNPRELAQHLKTTLEGKIEGVERIEVAGPGFINFFLTNEYFIKEVQEVLNNNEYGKNNSLNGMKIMIEYTDPNPFKQFHIGHLMSNAIGESLSRISEWNGAEVKRANYQGDVGLHVAKAIWGVMRKNNEMSSESMSLSDAAAFLGNAYVSGSDEYEGNPEAKKQIDDLNKTIFLKENEEVNKIYDWGRKVSLAHFEEIYEKLGTKFDYYFLRMRLQTKVFRLYKMPSQRGFLRRAREQ